MMPLMPLYDLHKQTGPSAEIGYLYLVVLNFLTPGRIPRETNNLWHADRKSLCLHYM